MKVTWYNNDGEVLEEDEMEFVSYTPDHSDGELVFKDADGCEWAYDLVRPFETMLDWSKAIYDAGGLLWFDINDATTLIRCPEIEATVRGQS